MEQSRTEGEHVLNCSQCLSIKSQQLFWLKETPKRDLIALLFQTTTIGSFSISSLSSQSLSLFLSLEKFNENHLRY